MLLDGGGNHFRCFGPFCSNDGAGVDLDDGNAHYFDDLNDRS